MTKLSTREFAARALIALAIAALIALLWRVSMIFVLIFGGIVVAAVLRALIRIIERWTPLAGGWSLAAAIIGVIVVVGLIGLLIGARLAAQVGQLTQTLPGAWQRARAAIESTSVGSSILSTLQSQATAGHWAARVGELATITFGALVNAAVIAFTGLYFAADPLLYQRGVSLLAPIAVRRDVQEALELAGEALGRWLKGVLLSMLSIGLVTGVGLWLLGVPLALSLGVLSGIFEFIPYVGPILAAVPAVLVAFTLGPAKALEVICLYVAVHFFEGEVLVPIIQRWTVALPPALSIIAVVVFGWLFGLVGIVFATPLAVVIIALVDRLYVQGLQGHRT